MSYTSALAPLFRVTVPLSFAIQQDVVTLVPESNVILVDKHLAATGKL